MLKIILFTSTVLLSCGNITHEKSIPDKFLNIAINNKTDYDTDCIKIQTQLKRSLLNKEDFLNNKSYSESTELIIDSIVYSPDFSRLAIFLITKNPTYKQLMPNKDYDWYYEATCYLGLRENDTIRLSWIGPSFTNSYDKQEVSILIRESCLTNFATKDTIGVFTYKYNMNDIRFWNSSIWQEIEEKRKRKKEFEEEKKRNPQNVYEPNKL